MKITLTEWAKKNYDPPPPEKILKHWAKSGQIPSAERVGWTWMVDENAVRVQIAVNKNLAIPFGVDPDVIKRALRQ